MHIRLQGYGRMSINEHLVSFLQQLVSVQTKWGIGKCQNWKVSELESARIGKRQNWKVSESERQNVIVMMLLNVLPKTTTFRLALRKYFYLFFSITQLGFDHLIAMQRKII